MAFPFVFEENFELGTLGGFNSESDASGRLDFAHYSQLAKVPGLSAPWRGAFCMRVNLGTSTTDAYVQEDDGFDIAADGTLHFRYMFYISKDIVMATTNEFIMTVLQSAGPVSEIVVALNYTTANGYRIGIGETAGASFLPVSLGVWHCLEVSISLDDGVSDDGTIDAWLDGSPFTQVASLDQAAITQARIGVIGQDAGTTQGYILYDQITVDDARMGPLYSRDRFPTSIYLTKSSHVYMGEGCLKNVTLMSGAATDNVLSVFDTDVGNSNAGQLVLELKNTANSELVDPADMPKHTQRGCFVQLTGTNPRAMVSIGHAQGYWSDGRIRNHGASRSIAPANL